MGRAYSQKELRILYTQSGNLCAFPGCNVKLTHTETAQDDAVNTSDIAHIVADSRQGPRGRVEMTDEERNKHTNLILLCEQHHGIIDAQPHTFSVGVLRQMKADHQLRVAKLAEPNPRPPKLELIKEVLHSTLLAATHFPAIVYAASCKYPNDENAVKKELVYPHGRNDLIFPFILRDGKIFTFDNLRRSWSVFQNVVNTRQVEQLPAEAMWVDPEGHRRYITLLNRSFYKYAGRFNIRFDPMHHRFYFAVDGVGEERFMKYRPLNQSESQRKVAWLPKNKSTGEPRNFWIHLGAGLRFHHVAPLQWCLSIRPERHLTSDGVTPLAPEKIGPRVTRMKAKMYNFEYLTEVQFWRDVLCEGQPRLILHYGEQSLICDSTLVTSEVNWPGIPEDTKPFKNQSYSEDLFSLADFDRAMGETEETHEIEDIDFDMEESDVDV